jgi:hypothetical protein
MERIEIRYGDLETVVFINRSYPDSIDDASRRAMEIFSHAAGVLAMHDWTPQLICDEELVDVEDDEE